MLLFHTNYRNVIIKQHKKCASITEEAGSLAASKDVKTGEVGKLLDLRSVSTVM